MRYEKYNAWVVDTFQNDDSFGRNGRKTKRFIATCSDCGNEYSIIYSDVKSGKSKRCKSCSVTARNMKHGESNSMLGTRLYNIWSGMRDRCNNKNNQSYSIYGGKGVTVCDEWDDFLVFKKWSLDNGYDDTLVLDKDFLCEKLNVQPKKYSPETCQWITRSANSRMSGACKPSPLAKFNMSVANRVLSDDDILKIRKMISIGLTGSEIMKIIDVSESTISGIRNGTIITIKELRSSLHEETKIT